MELLNWLNDNKERLSAALIESNRNSIIGNKILSYTTKGQVVTVLKDIRTLILPGIYEKNPVDITAIETATSEKLERISYELFTVIKNMLVHECEQSGNEAECTQKAIDITKQVLEGLPGIRKILDADIRAAYEGDPAAKSFEEIILGYPSLEAISIYRIAHLIHSFNVPIIPRIMTEYAHRNTGIDIHPGAAIGEGFFIDHGTGVVIGETCTIGNNVKLYQGVTLGAKSFPLDGHGNPIKGIKRHPDIEDNVVIYAGATILGGGTRIGHSSVIGGNVWLTESVPPYSLVFNSEPSPYIKSI